MKKLAFLTMAMCLFAVGAFAQKANYSGTWKLDAAKSKLDERARIESITLTVGHSEKELKVESVTKRMPPMDNAGGPGGGRGRGGFGGGDGTTVYTLNGESRAEVDGPMGKTPVSYKSSVEADGSLKLSQTRTFNGPNGEMTMTTNEVWNLSADGKTLTVNRESTSPRGAQTSTMVFVKG